MRPFFKLTLKIITQEIKFSANTFHEIHARFDNSRKSFIVVTFSQYIMLYNIRLKYLAINQRAID